MESERDGGRWGTTDDAGSVASSIGSSIPPYAKFYRDREELMYPAAKGPHHPLDAGMSAVDSNSVVSSDVASVALGLGRGDRDVVDKYMTERDPNRPAARLPIMRERVDIVDKIQTYQVTVISGPTGCGKTTQVPQFILEHCHRENLPANIIVTQPRRLAAASVARRVAAENGWELGKLVGYKVGLDKTNCSPDTRLLYCTTGMFKKMLINKKSLNDWTHVILDEVHERELDMDFVLLLCKRLLKTNSGGVRLVLMSATMDAAELAEYYTVHPGSAGTHDIASQKTNHKIDLYSLEQLEYSLRRQVIPWPEFDDLSEPRLDPGCIQVAVEILKKCKSLDQHYEEKGCDYALGAVLVFLPGEREIAQVKAVFEEHENKEGHEKWWIIPLHSRIPFASMQ